MYCSTLSKRCQIVKSKNMGSKSLLHEVLILIIKLTNCNEKEKALVTVNKPAVKM